MQRVEGEGGGASERDQQGERLVLAEIVAATGVGAFGLGLYVCEVGMGMGAARLGRSMRSSACSSMSRALAAEHCTMPGAPPLSMRAATRTASPIRVYLSAP